MPFPTKKILEDFLNTYISIRKQRSPESLKNICFKYVSKNNTLFNVKSLPNDLQEDLEEFSNKEKTKTINPWAKF